MAAALAWELGVGASVEDVLRFEKAMIASRSGGTRNPQALYQNLRIVRAVPSRRLILVDDTVVTSAHMQAAAARLWDCGAEVVLAICAAGCERDVVPQPFAIRVRSVDDLPFQRRKVRGAVLGLDPTPPSEIVSAEI
jgi:hypothetical protein